MCLGWEVRGPDRGQRDECFQFPESRFFRSGPSPRFLLFSQAVEGAGYTREVRDEPTVEVYEAHEGLNLGDVLWGRVTRRAGVDRARSSGRSGSEFGRTWLQRAGRCADSSFVSGLQSR